MDDAVIRWARAGAPNPHPKRHMVRLPPHLVYPFYFFVNNRPPSPARVPTCHPRPSFRNHLGVFEVVSKTVASFRSPLFSSETKLKKAFKDSEYGWAGGVVDSNLESWAVEHARCLQPLFECVFGCRATVTDALRCFDRIKEWVVADGLQHLTVSRYSHTLAYRVGREDGGNEWK